MRKKIIFGVVTGLGSLFIKLCHNVSKDYVDKRKDNPTKSSKIIKASVNAINALSDALDLAMRAMFIVRFV